MSKKQTVTIDLGSTSLTLESGLLAQQAAGAVSIRQGDTVLFTAVTNTKVPREGIDYFPLQVEYREKFYAAGRFPGGFFKREARPAEKEILVSRYTDRPIRPLFPEGYHNDVQINSMLLSADGKYDSDALSITAASAALTISEIPFLGPIAGVRIGRVNGEFVINPDNEARAESDFELIYAGTRELPVMIEGSSKGISEADLVAAMRLAQEAVVKMCDGQLELRRALGLPDKVVNVPVKDETLKNAAAVICGSEFLAALSIVGKLERQNRISEIKADLKAKLLVQFPEMEEEAFRGMFDDLEIGLVKNNMLEHGKRIDGRAPEELRGLYGEVGLLPRTHGSAVFNRGETQALGTLTLGTKSDIQKQDAIAGGETSKKFMLHYNFPPYSVGECGRLGFTGRREIGHGALAERALREVVPDDYPYTMRLVSDIMGSNGSSSMASCCVGTMAMMDAGVPITAPVAGISIGMFCNDEKAVLITDILGAEDHCGDMDFKVAGTRDVITAFQVDLKIPGLKWDLVEGAFALAKKSRCEIIDFMETVIAAPREEMAEHAPRITQVSIDPEKIGELIGPGGKNIRRITETSGAQIDIDEDGTVNIFAANSEAMAVAVREVEMIAADPEIGMLYEGTVSATKDFGAFVEFLPGRDGLVHISELADCRVNSVEDICKPGDKMWVKCVGVDDRNRVKLSRREAMRDMDEQEKSD